MSTLRISNIEAKSVPASATVDEKVKITNSSGDTLVFIDGKTSGITTVGINTTDSNITFDANSNVVVTGIITATKFVGTIEPTNLTVGGDLTIPDKIIHTGDTNTAIRFPANDTISFETSNNERLRITHNGRVGIGTDNPPDCTLTVCEFNSGTGIADNIALRLQGSSGQNVALQFTDTTGAAAYIALQGDALRLGTNNTERLRIESAGNTDVKRGLRVSGSDTAWGSGSEGAFMDYYAAGSMVRLGHVNGASGSAKNILFYTGGSEKLKISNIGHLTTQGNNVGNPIGMELRNNNTAAYSHAELSLTSQNTTTSKIWCDVPNAGMRLQYNGGTTVKVNQSGNLVMASGSGIDFSGSSNASGMTSELLDDYEEGSWTPDVKGRTGGSWQIRVGQYTKIGRMVSCQCHVNISNLTSSQGPFVINGLPFTSANITNNYSVTSSVHFNNSFSIGGDRGMFNGLLAGNSNEIAFYAKNGAGIFAVAASDFVSGNILFEITYMGV